jgi:hypothetical protein
MAWVAETPKTLAPHALVAVNKSRVNSPARAVSSRDNRAERAARAQKPNAKEISQEIERSYNRVIEIENWFAESGIVAGLSEVTLAPLLPASSAIKAKRFWRLFVVLRRSALVPSKKHSHCVHPSASRR